MGHEDILRDEALLMGPVGRGSAEEGHPLCMVHGGDVLRAGHHEENPPHYTGKHGSGCLINISKVFGGYQQVAQ